MDFKPAIKLLGLLLLILALLAIAALSTAGAINYTTAGGPKCFAWGGIANGACWTAAIVRFIVRKIKEGRM
ncbi:MAG: hypothetical protein K6G86_07795 [Bacteroidales bacterium]|nr:hypothetical protein [Bacteroidales bacterium]